MGEPHVLDVVHELGRQLDIGQRTLAFVGLLPASQVHLVDRDRRIDVVARRPLVHPGLVLPRPPEPGLAHHRTGRRRVFRTDPHRVGLERHDHPVTGADLVFVGCAFADAGQENLPYPGRTARAHRVHRAVPGVEIAHHRDPLRIRRPDGEMRAFHLVDGLQMRAQRFPQPPVAALAQQVFVELAQHRAEPVGIDELPAHPLGIRCLERVGLGRIDRAFEKMRTPRVFRQGHGFLAPLLDLERHRPRHPDGKLAVLGPEHPERVAMPPLRDRPGFFVKHSESGVAGFRGRAIVHGVLQVVIKAPKWRPRCPSCNHGSTGQTRRNPSARC